MLSALSPHLVLKIFCLPVQIALSVLSVLAFWPGKLTCMDLINGLPYPLASSWF